MEMISVLIIDDHAGFRRSLKQYLISHGGFEIIGEAPNALEGLAMAYSHRPQIVLLDIRMPGLNGLNIIEKLRNELPDLLVIVLTLWDTPEYRRAALNENKADAYLIKENMVSDLIPTIQKLFKKTDTQPPMYQFRDTQ